MGKPTNANRKILVIGVFAVVVGFVIGILIGRFGTCPDQPKPKEEAERDGTFLPGIPSSIIQDGDPEIGRMLIDAVDNKRLEDNLRRLTRDPHVAGSNFEHELARWIKQEWEDVGMDDVTLTPYEVLLSFPDPANPNVVRLLDETGSVVYESPLREANLTGVDRPDALPPYLAYSPPGLVEGDVVYVNYARVEDFDWLANSGINVTGKIVIARYGKIFRGSKVDLATRYGAKAIIIFSDPDDYAYEEDPRVYPDTWWLPGSGAQRGTIFSGIGDPLTPGYPATKNAYRYDESDPITDLPRIPAHPIGYDIAGKLLKEMSGPVAPDEWQGKIPGVTYKLGPALAKSGWKMQMNISTTNQMKTIFNVIGTVRGLVEPDRYVLMGNHRDAWVYGAIDPSSGTTVMMETARVIGQLVKSGKWRPRRSIMFCSWGAEEYGLLGSNEWVEQYNKNLRERAVTYVNVDVAVEANFTMRALANPLLYRATYAAAKKIPNPNPSEVSAGRKTLYDTWLHSSPWTEGGVSLDIPHIGPLGTASDYGPLVQKAGISAVDIGYTFDKKKYKISHFPLYHSVYETFFAVKEHIDRDFHYHQAMSRLTAEMLRDLSDSLILPFNVSDYSWALNTYLKTLDDDFGSKLRPKIDHYDDLAKAIATFGEEVEIFNERLSNVNKNNPMAIRAFNDQLMLLENAFLDSAGLPNRPERKHMVLAESSVNIYAGSSFPGIVDLMFKIEEAPDVDARWELVKRHFRAVVFTIESAASTLRNVIKFMPKTT